MSSFFVLCAVFILLKNIKKSKEKMVYFSFTYSKAFA